MKTKIALAITFVAGMLVLIAEFIPHRPFGNITSALEDWFMIISGFAILLGQFNLVKVNFIKVKERMPNWPYFVITLVSFFGMVIAGFLWGTKTNPGLLGHGQGIQAAMGAKPFDYLFENVYIHLSSTMFALLAFFIASAAYRAFIARSIEAKLLLVAAVIVMLGNTSFGGALTGWLPENLKPWLHLPRLSQFIMQYINTAGQRAIMISAGLGVIGSSLRIILGIERAYLGGGNG